MTEQVIYVTDAQAGSDGFATVVECAEESNANPPERSVGALRGCSSYLKIR